MTNPTGQLTTAQIIEYAQQASQSIISSGISVQEASQQMKQDCAGFFASHGFPIDQLPPDAAQTINALAAAGILAPPDCQDIAPNQQGRMLGFLPDWSASCWGCVIGLGVTFAVWNFAITIATGGLATLIADTAFVAAVASILGVSAATTATALGFLGSFAIRDIIVDVLCGAIGACKEESGIVLPQVGTYVSEIYSEPAGWIEQGIHNVVVADEGQTVTIAGVKITTGSVEKDGTFVWTNQQGSSRGGCPTSGSIKFGNNGSSFSGTCTFSGMNPINFQGTLSH